MKKRKFFSLLRHAVQMVGRTWKSYALLSVTIVMSFSLLLGYLLLSDTNTYNKYKHLFRYRREDVQAYFSDHDETLRLALESLEKMENTGYFVTHRYHLGRLSTKYEMDLYSTIDGLETITFHVYATMVPDYSWFETVRYGGETTDIVWLDGQAHSDFVLEADQVIVTEAIYQFMGMDRQETPMLQLEFQYGQKLALEVVGYTTNESFEEWKTTQTHYSAGSENHYLCYMDILLSTKFIPYAHLHDESYWQTYSFYKYPKQDGSTVYICSETPERVVSLLETMDVSYSSIYQRQNAALDAIRPEKRVKAIVTCALLLLLGINLYSSFTNAMNDRKYEIGVKRAVGASAWSIVRQFLYESMAVMLANILVSVALVADVAIVYKYIKEHTPNDQGLYEDYILYISEYSMGMFLTCAVTLTVVFSLIFAYKSTRVEIVQYLKAE